MEGVGTSYNNRVIGQASGENDGERAYGAVVLCAWGGLQCNGLRRPG